MINIRAKRDGCSNSSRFIPRAGICAVACRLGPTGRRVRLFVERGAMSHVGCFLHLRRAGQLPGPGSLVRVQHAADRTYLIAAVIRASDGSRLSLAQQTAPHWTVTTNTAGQALKAAMPRGIRARNDRDRSSRSNSQCRPGQLLSLTDFEYSRIDLLGFRISSIRMTARARALSAVNVDQRIRSQRGNGHAEIEKLRPVRFSGFCGGTRLGCCGRPCGRSRRGHATD